MTQPTYAKRVAPLPRRWRTPKPVAWVRFQDRAPHAPGLFCVTPYADRSCLMYAYWTGKHWTCPAQTRQMAAVLRDVPFVPGQPMWWSAVNKTLP